jgi:hypothetical protein
LASKLRVRLFHWHEAEAAERAAALQKAGFEADFDHKVEPGFARRLAARPPDVLVIDLSRLPSHGREVGIYARRAKITRLTPIVFGGGEPEKVEKVRTFIPDAVYTDWSAIKSAVRAAVKNAPLAPIKPDPYMQRWAASPLSKKLGLVPGTKAVLIGAPEGFAEFVNAPDGVEYTTRASAHTQLAMIFAQSADELDMRLGAAVGKLAAGSHLWICWPKAGSKRYRSDLTQHLVLATARLYDLATSKIASIDSDWSGMKFSARKTYRKG